MPMQTLFFDLDGTLIDSQVGIFRSAAYALERLGRPVPGEEVMAGWIGPPMRDSFALVLESPEQVEMAMRLYRERYDRDGWREHTVYPGIEEAVRTLHAAGHRMAVVTAKNEPHARRIVEHLPFGSCFDDVVGATPDGRLGHKPELIGEALRRLTLPAEACVMIGDRRMDMEGAVQHRMRGIGVLWGFGSEDELRAAGAQVLVRTPGELPAWLAA